MLLLAAEKGRRGGVGTYLGDEGGDHSPDAAEGGAEAHPQRAHGRRVDLHRKHVSTRSYFDTRRSNCSYFDLILTFDFYFLIFVFSKIHLNQM